VRPRLDLLAADWENNGTLWPFNFGLTSATRERPSRGTAVAAHSRTATYVYGMPRMMDIELPACMAHCTVPKLPCTKALMYRLITEVIIPLRALHQPVCSIRAR